MLSPQDFSKAWAFYRMLGEPEPMREALEQFTPSRRRRVPGHRDRVQSGVLPKKGFDLVIDRHGICSAITMVSGSDLASNPRSARLLRRAARDLRCTPTYRTIEGDLATRALRPGERHHSAIVEMHPELFADDAYHIDTSPCSSVVQMSTHLRSVRN